MKEEPSKKKVPTLGGVHGTDANSNLAQAEPADKQAGEKIVKAKYWAGIIYPESIPDNWQEIITASHVPCVVSPLHDKDVNADGTPKKPHYHVMFCYSNTTTGSSASHILAQLGSSLHAERVMSAVGNYRYLTHRDNPEKAQYDERDILAFNGFSYTDHIGQRTATEQIEMGKRLMEIVLADECPPNYIALLQYLQMTSMDAELEYAMTHTYFIKEVLASKRAYNGDVLLWQELKEAERKAMEGQEQDDTSVSDKGLRG